MSSQNEKVKVVLVSSTTRRGIYLPSDISYLDLLNKVRNKFELDKDAGYSLCYKLSLNDDPMEITDDEEVNFFIEAARNVDGKPLELLVRQSSISQQNDHVHFPTTYLPISQHSNLHPHLHDHSSQYHNSAQYHQSAHHQQPYNIDEQYTNPQEQQTWKQYLNAPLFSSPPPYQNAHFNSQVNPPIFHNFFENHDNETQKYSKQVFQDNHDVQHYTCVPDTYDAGTSQKWSFDGGDGMEDNAESEEQNQEEMGGKSGEENEQGSDGDEDNIKFKYILPQDWQKNTFCHMPNPEATSTSDIKQKKPKSSSKTIIWEGQWFLDKKDCKKTISLKSMDDGYEYKVRKSDKKRYDVICVNEGCPWKILTHRAIDGPGFHVTTVHDHHTCSKTNVKPKHRNATKEVIGDIIMEQLRDPNRVLKPKDIVHDIGANFQVDITYLQAWRGKANALEKLMGTHEESFCKLPCYLHNLKLTNPGSFTDIKTDDYGRFEMCFVAIGAVIRSFVNHLRPLIIVDGAHLKGKYIGSNLVAVAMDGNNKIVPLAYGVSPGEAGPAWSWFFAKLRECIGDIPNMAVISDRHPSIALAVRCVMPRAIHLICCRHLEMNLSSKNSEINGLYWKICKAHRVDDFDQYMGKSLPRRQKWQSSSFAGMNTWEKVYQ